MRRVLFCGIIFVGFCGVFLLVNFNRENSEAKPLILVYHDIREADEQTGSSEFVTPLVFEQQMKYLASQGFHVTSLRDYNRKKENAWRTVVLTFDDTWKSQYEAAVPILEKYAFGATFFINSDWAGKPSFMTWDTVRTLSANPLFEIGGHTRTHPHLKDIPSARQKDEITGDKEIIEREVGKGITSFAYPYGEQSDEIEQIVKKSGYVIARSINVARDSTDHYALASIIVKNDLDALVKVVTRMDYAYERAYWNGRISAGGGEETYRVFKQQYEHAPHNIAHNIAHIFGEILYGRGIENITVCDTTFIFGCYHGLLGKAIAREGIDVLPKLDEVCRKKGKDWLGCHHGIGHGIMSYFGDKRLVEALEACKTLSWKGDIAGCYGGLFMEYNFRNAHIVSDTEYVRQNTGDVYFPCNEIPDMFKSACFYEQPDWWRRLFKEDYKKLGELCDSIVDKENKKYCFVGVGRMAAQSMDYNEVETIKECDRMSSSENTALCRAGGFLSIFDKTGSQRNLSMCNGVAREYSKVCLEKAQMFMKSKSASNVH